MTAFVFAVCGAVFCGAVCLALGSLILGKLTTQLARAETAIFSFFIGSAALSWTVFALTAAHLAYGAVFVAFGLAVVALSLCLHKKPDAACAHSRLPRKWVCGLAILCLPFIDLYLGRALGPEYSADGTYYHLALVARYLREHHFPLITTDFRASYPAGIEMLFLFAFSVGKHSAAAATHLLFLFATAIALITFGLRFRAPTAGIAAAAFFFIAPVVGMDATTAYVEVGWASACFACFYALQIWRQDNNPHMLIIAGAMAGFSASIKYPGFVAIAFALGVVLWHARRNRAEWRRALPMLMIPAILLSAPWLVKNMIEVGNPFSPIGNRLFPNPYVHISFEDGHLQRYAHLHGLTWPELPLQVTVFGGKVAGILGPIFLLAPIGLLAARSAMGRQVLLAALVFALHYPAHLETRFLIPALPFVSLAMAMAIESWPAALAATALLHGALCLPYIEKKYADRYLEILEGRWSETLRIRPEADTLAQRTDGYAMGRFINETLPENVRIFQIGGMARAYVNRVVDGYYEGALNEKLYYAFFSGVFPEWAPNQRCSFQFAPIVVKRVKVRQTATSDRRIWTVSELRLLDRGQEIPVDRAWQLAARPFPWDIALAFDGNPVTSWKAWERARPGMFIEVTFSRPTEISGVAVDSPHDQDDLRLTVHGEESTGRVLTLAETCAREEYSLPNGWRRLIGREFRSHGYTHFAIRRDVAGYNEVRRDPGEWGMQFVAERGEYILCRFE